MNQINDLSGAEKWKNFKYALMKRAGSIIFDPKKQAAEQHRTCWCHRGVANKSDSVSIYRQTSGASARMRGVTTCKSVWACPVCSARICAARQVELFEAQQEWAKQGGYTWLMTLTFPHERGMPLAGLMKKFGKATAHFKNSKTYKRILARGVRKGTVSSLEVTFGAEHGWHPHRHDLVFATPDVFGIEKLAGQDLTEDERRAGHTKLIKGDDGRMSSRLIDELKEAWYTALRKAGLCEQSQMTEVLNHGLDVRGGQYAAEYILKFGKEQKWGLSREVTMHACKTGMKQDGEYHGAHPFQLLAWADNGDGDACAQFREYVDAFEGKRMLTWSKGLKKDLTGQDETTDDQAEERALPDEERVGRIDSEALSVLHSRWLLGHFLQFVAEQCNDPDTAQGHIDEYLKIAREEVPRVSRGLVKTRMYKGGFLHTDREQEEHAWESQFAEVAQ